MMLLIATALFAVFFFLTIYIQTVWGYSPIRAGLAWLPFPIMIIFVSTLVARVLVTRVGRDAHGRSAARCGGVLLAVTPRVDGSYFTSLLLPMLIVSGGPGSCSCP
jgi:hypothetical protein